MNNTIKSAYKKRGIFLSKPLFFVINQSMDVTPAYYEKRSVYHIYVCKILNINKLKMSKMKLVRYLFDFQVLN